jgi:hypothetical protein
MTKIFEHIDSKEQTWLMIELSDGSQDTPIRYSNGAIAFERSSIEYRGDFYLRVERRFDERLKKGTPYHNDHMRDVVAEWRW